MANYFLIFEITIYIMFIFLMLVQLTKKREERRFFVLISGLVFGLILEIGNMAAWHTYSYGDKFLIYIYTVPLGIGAAWAVLLYSAITISDRIGKSRGIPEYLLPFFDTTIVLGVDLVLDVLATKYSGWQWAIGENAEWFGVPYENFIGWIFVAFIFSIVVRTIMRVIADTEKRAALTNTKNKNLENKPCNMPGDMHSNVSANITCSAFFTAALTATLTAAISVISYAFLLIIFAIHTISINAIYYLKGFFEGKTITATEIFTVNTSITYTPWISQLKEVLFYLSVFSLLIIMAICLIKYRPKKRDAKLLARFPAKNKDFMLASSFIILIELTILCILIATKTYLEYPVLLIIQIGVLLLMLFLIALAAGISFGKTIKA